MRGLGLLDVVLAPHDDVDPRRQEALRRIAHDRRQVGVGLDDCAALEIIDDRCRILSCRARAMARRVDRAGSAHALTAHDDLRPLTDLTAAHPTMADDATRPTPTTSASGRC